eukprot:scaffold2219_cov177-Amphora_coffeaeformis.AAC.12
MKWTITNTFLILFMGYHATAFVPQPLPRTLLVQRTMVMQKTTDENKKKKDDDDWVANLQEWWDTVVSPWKDETQKESTVKDDWVTEDVHKMLDENAVDVMTTTKQPFDVEEKKKSDANPQQKVTAGVENKAKSEEKTKTVVLVEDKKKKEKNISAKDEWIVKDMNEAALGERATKDWVADDLQKTGRLGSNQTTYSSQEWVARDMAQAGRADRPQQTATKKKEKSRNDDIAEDMTKAGKLGAGDDWVTQDMKTAGAPKEPFQSTSWLKKLGDFLDTEKDRTHDDVQERMEKAGKEGAHSFDWVTDDMVRLGRAEKVQHEKKYSNDEKPYKIKLDAYDAEAIRKDMERLGHADSQDWVASDMKATGGKHDSGRMYLDPPKELSDRLHNQDRSTAVTKDMEYEGHGSTRRASKDELSKGKMEEMITKDMKKMGQSQIDDWVIQDMERAGHPDSHLNMDSLHHESHKDRETKEFMKTRKTKVASNVDKPHMKPPTYKTTKFGKDSHPCTVEAKTDSSVAGTETKPIIEDSVEPLDEAELAGFIVPKESKRMKRRNKKRNMKRDDEDEDHHSLLHNVVRVSKKVIHPRKPWKDIE